MKKLLSTFYRVIYYDELSMKDGDFNPDIFKNYVLHNFEEAKSYAQKHCDFTGASQIEQVNKYLDGVLRVYETVKVWECTQKECYVISG